MSELALQYRYGALYLPRLGLWLDPHDPKTGPEQVFVSHAHSDHVGAHREVILSAPTARLMQARLGGARLEHVLPFGETRPFTGAGAPYQLTLLPAGHIFGSAMSLIEAEGGSLLYTGDFKLRRGLSAEACEPRHADILVMETTYGRPRYQFPPTEAVLRGVVRFCREALDNEETPVLLGYSLGKSQELLCGLAGAGLPLMLHGAVHSLTQIYEQFGQCFPKYEPYDAATARGKVLVCPPSVSGSAMLRNLGRVRTAVLTGWAVEPNCRFRYRADAAFPLSDHADFSDLVDLVRQVAPRKVYTLHGFAADFAQTLRDLGFEAWALGESEQMGLPLAGSPKFKVQGSKFQVQGSDPPADPDPATAPPPAPSGSASPLLFIRFAETCAAIAATSGKLKKIELLAGYLQTLDEESLPRAVTWFTGLPFPASENKVLQLGWALLRDALCALGGIDPDQFNQVYLQHSDLGETALEIFQKRPATTPVLTLAAVDAVFDQLLAARGPAAKLPRLVEALRQCSALEAKFLVKTITSDLRIGLKEGLVEEAVARAFNAPADAVRQANLLLGNIGETALLARRNQLASASLVPFRPVKFMLASPEETAADIWERVQPCLALDPNEAQAPLNAPLAAPTVWVEDKYDGIRCQLHKVGDRVALYSRDLKDITRTFFDVADAARRLPADVILDGEIVAMRDDTALPFADLQKRLGRREDDLFLGAEIPIKYVAFDLLWLNGESYLNHPLAARRKALEALAPLPPCLRLAAITQAGSVADLEAAFAAARHRNNEGIMIKDPGSVYSPGRRGLAWLKLKKAYATLDCVVVGAEYGHGKRKSVLSDYTFAVRDKTTGALKTIGKAYSGLTDAEIAQLTTHFLGTAIRQHGRYFEVQPDTVLEIAFDRVQPSDRHTSGLALRFPRIVRIRTDKTPADIDTLATARKLVR